MKTIRKRIAQIFAAMLCVVLVLSGVPASAAELSKDLVVLYTNDVHTYIDGSLSYDTVAALKKDLQTRYETVLLVDAGDHLQGTAYGSMDRGKTIIDLMNAAGYDLATLGNHEFDYGMEGCKAAIDRAVYPYISCNFYHEENGVRVGNVLQSYALYDFGTEKVAFIGITTPESFSKTTPAYFQDEDGNYIYGISGGADGSALYAEVQRAVNEAKADGATKVVALGHLGVDPSSVPWTSREVIRNVSGLDAFIDGHSHTVIEGESVEDLGGNEVILTQTGEYFQNIGMMVIDAETGEITTSLISQTELDPDNVVQGMKDDWIQEIDAQLGAKIGTALVTLDNYDADGKRLVRSQETNTGDFSADALYYLFDDMGVDVAVMNGGGIRNTAINGDITYKICKDIHTFGNVACMLEISGQQLLDALEWSTCTVGGAENGSFFQVAGITYKVDSTIPSTVRKDDKDIWIGGPTGEYRVFDVTVYDRATDSYLPLDLNKTYRLAGYNYTLRDLGGGFAMFNNAVNVIDYVMEDYMVLANYVKAFENGEVDVKNSPLLAKHPNMLLDYGTTAGSGRITILNQPKYTVTFMGENGVIETITVREGERVTPPVLPQKEGYTVRWDQEIGVVSSDMVITAVYTKIPQQPSGESGSSQEPTVEPEQGEQPKAPEKEEASPDTGDASHTLYWQMLLAISGCGLLFLTLCDKKNIRLK